MERTEFDSSVRSLDDGLKSNEKDDRMKILMFGERIMDAELDVIMQDIVHAIAEAGYDPYAQLYGYVTKGKEEFITRNGNARAKIKKLNWLKVKQYVENWECHNNGTSGMGEANSRREEIPVIYKSEENT